MTYEDKTLVCRDCGKSFPWTARSQDFFAQQGFTNPPARCRDCKEEKKKKAATATPQQSKTLYKITCKNCDKVGEMATEPRKPNDVLCSECFYEAFKKQVAQQGPAPTAKAATTSDEIEQAA